MVLTSDPPVCHQGYQSTDSRPPQDGSNRPMNTKAHCAEPGAQSNPRGAQHAPSNRPAADYRVPVAWFDPETKRLTWGSRVPTRLEDVGSPAPAAFGEETWKWLWLQPLTDGRR
jgi:phospholipid/cholesterol/gamma-HCH transport system substrate-binding protein